MTVDPNIDKIGALAVDISEIAGVSYADCRMVQVTEEKVEVHTGAVDTLSRDESWGIGVRVLYNGYWGFAASAEVTPESAKILRDRAVEIATASARLAGDPAELAPVKVVQDEFRTKIKTDPFTIPLKEKLEYVKHLDSLLRADSALSQTVAGLEFRREMRYFYSSEGSRIHQEIYQSGAGISAGITSGHRASFTRSYPTSSGQYETAGYELLEKLKFEDAVGQLIEETKAVAAAEDCPSFTGTLILSGDLMSLQIHESIGHPLELDRVYGSERNFSGTSFATPEKLGNLKYASDIVTVYTDPTAPGGLASFGYDDEGVPAARSPLIEKGLLVGYLTSRETATRIGTTSNASMRAKDWGFLPLIRMTNTILEPGNKKLDDMIAETDDGIFIQTPSSWSIDDRRDNFQLGGEYGRLIKGGKLPDVVKNPTYSGNTVQFWNSCDAIGTKDEYRIWGTPTCGKGQPGQTIATAQGTAPARFQNIKIGA